MTETKLREITQGTPSTGRKAQLTMIGLESKIDETIAAAGRLYADVLGANGEAGLHPALTQSAIAALTAGLNAAVELRSHAIAAHSELSKTAGQLDLQELGWGDFEFSPPSAELLRRRRAAKLRSVVSA